MTQKGKELIDFLVDRSIPSWKLVKEIMMSAADSLSLVEEDNEFFDDLKSMIHRLKQEFLGDQIQFKVFDETDQVIKNSDKDQQKADFNQLNDSFGHNEWMQ